MRVSPENDASPQGGSEDGVGYRLWQFDRRHLSPWRLKLAHWWRAHARGARSATLLLSTFVLGALLAYTPETQMLNLQLSQQLEQQADALRARQGELELARLELARVNRIVEFSGAHRVPADLAASIYDIALAEGIDPGVAFGLVRVESEFYPRALSSKGAVGLTQVMPSTATWLQPGIRYDALFERDTNLRLGFRYLRMLMEQYDGDLSLALLAYNRGPGTVDGILRNGRDPGNGYAQAVRSHAARAE